MDYPDTMENRMRMLRVLDLETSDAKQFSGYVDGSGRAWIARNGDLSGPIERVSYVNLGCTLHGACAAYVLRKQLQEDVGLYRFNKRAAAHQH